MATKKTKKPTTAQEVKIEIEKTKVQLKSLRKQLLKMRWEKLLEFEKEWAKIKNSQKEEAKKSQSSATVVIPESVIKENGNVSYHDNKTGESYFYTTANLGGSVNIRKWF